MANSLLEVHEIVTEFRTPKGALRAVDGVSFHVDYGEVLGVVGKVGAVSL